MAAAVEGAVFEGNEPVPTPAGLHAGEGARRRDPDDHVVQGRPPVVSGGHLQLPGAVARPDFLPPKAPSKVGRRGVAAEDIAVYFAGW